jgi:hypothetical protein
MPDNPNPTSTPPAPTGETPGHGEMPQTQDNEQPTFDAWLAQQPDPIKGLVTEHTQGLRSALDTERQQRKDLAKQIKELAGKQAADSDAAKQLGELSASLEAAQKRADFYEAATAAGCIKLKPAYLVAQADNLTIEQVKAQYPELFAAPRHTSTHAGNGTGQPPPSSVDMNQAIRRAAGLA